MNITNQCGIALTVASTCNAAANASPLEGYLMNNETKQTYLDLRKVFPEWGAQKTLGIARRAVELWSEARQSLLTKRAHDLLNAPACCASFVFDGTHHKDCRFAKTASG